jgi:hypothetical protein
LAATADAVLTFAIEEIARGTSSNLPNPNSGSTSGCWAPHLATMTEKTAEDSQILNR